MAALSLYFKETSTFERCLQLYQILIFYDEQGQKMVIIVRPVKMSLAYWTYGECTRGHTQMYMQEGFLCHISCIAAGLFEKQGSEKGTKTLIKYCENAWYEHGIVGLLTGPTLQVNVFCWYSRSRKKKLMAATCKTVADIGWLAQSITLTSVTCAIPANRVFCYHIAELPACLFLFGVQCNTNQSQLVPL